MTVRIVTIGGYVHLTAPFHPEFAAAARDLGGIWHSATWRFDARDEQRVRDLCMDIWGTDGTPCELVTLRCRAASRAFDAAGTECELYLAGRQVAKVFGKSDVRARLGSGVVMLSGRFHGGGSSKNPYCSWADGTTFELRDIPRAAAERARAESPELIEIIASPLSPAPETVRVNPERQALVDERAQLLSRLAVIDIELAKLPAIAATTVFEVADELRDQD